MTARRERLTLRMPKNLKEKLEQEANKLGISVNALIIWKLNQRKEGD